MQTIFDTSVLILVLYKTIKESMGPKSARGIRTIIATHGILYYLCVILIYQTIYSVLTGLFYSVVFGVNIAWAIMVLTATVSNILCFTLSFLNLLSSDRSEVHDGRVSAISNHITAKSRIDVIISCGSRL